MESGTENFYWFWDWLRDASKRTGTGISPDMAPAIATDISPVKGCCVYPWHLFFPLEFSPHRLCGKKAGNCQ